MVALGRHIHLTYILFLSYLINTTERNFRTMSEIGKNDETCTFKLRGSILRGISSNESVIVTIFNLNFQLSF